MHRYALHGKLTRGTAAIAVIFASVIVPAQMSTAPHDPVSRSLAH